MKGRWLSRFATWSDTDTGVMLWAGVALGVVCVVNFIAARTLSPHLGIGIGLGMVAAAVLIGRKGWHR